MAGRGGCAASERNKEAGLSPRSRSLKEREVTGRLSCKHAEKPQAAVLRDSAGRFVGLHGRCLGVRVAVLQGELEELPTVGRACSFPGSWKLCVPCLPEVSKLGTLGILLKQGDTVSTCLLVAPGIKEPRSPTKQFAPEVQVFARQIPIFHRGKIGINWCREDGVSERSVAIKDRKSWLCRNLSWRSPRARSRKMS